ncbi:MAG: hypothetical protein LBQ66_03945, partial [Planctomycetaceae bacterium]|nr:hypothetical protein [Planctomycetaceae bacterium]
IILTENSLLKTSVIVDIIGALPRVVFVNPFRRALPYANVETQCIASLLYFQGVDTANKRHNVTPPQNPK